MKKLISIILAVLLLAGFAACSGKQGADNAETSARELRDGEYTCTMTSTGGMLSFNPSVNVRVANRSATATVVCLERSTSYAELNGEKLMPIGGSNANEGLDSGGSNKSYPTFELPMKFDTDIPVSFFVKNGDSLIQVDCTLRFSSEGATYTAATRKR